MKRVALCCLIAAAAPIALAAETQSKKTIQIEVTEKGFVPSSIDVKPGTDVTLVVTRKTDSTCATNIQVPVKNIKNTDLPLNKPVTIALGVLTKGEIKFGCGMNMMDSGNIHVK